MFPCNTVLGTPVSMICAIVNLFVKACIAEHNGGTKLPERGAGFALVVPGFVLVDLVCIDRDTRDGRL